jgi:hypothetical protein
MGDGTWRLLGDLVVAVHFSFVVFVVAGGALVWRWPGLAWLHLPAVAWGGSVELFGWACPLTELEIRFGALAGQGISEGDFIARLLVPLIYPGWLTREAQIAIGASVLFVNAFIYAMLFIRARRTAALRRECRTSPPCRP